MKVVIVSGGFDPIHSGHILQKQKARDKLIVALNSNHWFEKKKGKYFLPLKKERLFLKVFPMLMKF